MKKFAIPLLMLSLPLPVLANQGFTSVTCPSEEMVRRGELTEPLIGTFKVSDPQLLTKVIKWEKMTIVKNRFICDYDTTSSEGISLISPMAGTTWTPFIFPGQELSSPWSTRGFTPFCTKSLMDCSVTRPGLG